jgi:GAF domain-containing protein
LHQLNLISHSLSSFLHHDEDIDDMINDILKSILNFYQGDRTYIFEFNEDKSIQINTHEVVKNGIVSEKEVLQNVESKDIPWWTERVLSGQSIILNNLDELPDNASILYDILRAQGILSIMVVPLSSDNIV